MWLKHFYKFTSPPVLITKTGNAKIIKIQSSIIIKTAYELSF